MVRATITSKGQITIPKEVRTSLGLNAGDQVAFVVHGHSEAVLTPVTRSVDEVFGRLCRKNVPVLSVEEMNKAVMARIRKRSS